MAGASFEAPARRIKGERHLHAAIAAAVRARDAA